QEMSQQTIGASPYEWGERVARRFCQYAILPVVAKALHGAGKKSVSAALGEAGASGFNPLKGAAVSDQWTDLAGKFVKLGGKTYEVGQRRFKGAFLSAYEVKGQPGKLLKIPRPDEVGTNGIRGQLEGSEVLKDSGIPTPDIYAASPGAGTEPPYM